MKKCVKCIETSYNHAFDYESTEYRLSGHTFYLSAYKFSVGTYYNSNIFVSNVLGGLYFNISRTFLVVGNSSKP